MTPTDSPLSVPLIGVTMCVTSLHMLAPYMTNYLSSQPKDLALARRLRGERS